MTKKLRYLCTLLLMMVASAMLADDFSETYTSNIELSADEGILASECKVIIGEEEYYGLKAGSGSKAGAICIKVPQGTAQLSMHVAGWKGENVKLSYKVGENTSSISLTANDGITSNSPYTFSGDPSSEDYFKTITFSPALTEDTDITFQTTQGKRFVIFGVNVPSANSPTDPVVTISGTSVEVGSSVSINYPEDLEVSFSSSSTTIATVDENGVVTGVAAGEATITAAWEATTIYNEGSQEFQVTVTDPVAATVYKKVNNVNQLVAGNEYILVATALPVAMGKASGNLRSGVSVTIKDDEICIKDEAVTVLALGGNIGAWTFLASDNGKYLALSTDGNQLNSSDDATETASKWTITDDFQVISNAYPERYIQYNSGSPRFVCYKNNQVAAYLYVKKDSPINTKIEPGFSYSAATAEANIGEDFTAPTFSNPNNVAVTYTSSEPTVATIDESGNVTILAAGTTVISASSLETNDYLAGTASYTLTVIDPNAPGTENNPYTVTQARAAIDAGNGVTGVYATGIVSEIVTEYSSEYDNISYNISENGSKDAVQLQIYRGKGNEDTSASEIRVGDKVVVTGNLKKYNSTYEFDQGSTLVSLEHPTTPIIEVGNVSLAYDQTSGEIVYTISNAPDDYGISVSSDEGWLTIYPGNPISIECEENTGHEARTATVTITLIYDNNEKEVTSTVTVTQAGAPVVYDNIPDMFEAATKTATDVKVKFDGWVVTGVSSNGKNVFVSDGTNGFIIYGAELGFEVGNTLASSTPISCKLQLFNGSAEITELTASTEGLTVGTGGSVGIADITMANLAGVNTGALVSYKNLTCTVEVNNEKTYYYLSDGTTTLQVYNTLFAFGALEADKKYDITGVYQQYSTNNRETKEILPRSAEDIKEATEEGTISTGINSVEQTIGDAAIYNLNGVRVNKVQKGVYVVNGKKVVIK